MVLFSKMQTKETVGELANPGSSAKRPIQLRWWFKSNDLRVLFKWQAFSLWLSSNLPPSSLLLDLFHPGVYLEKWTKNRNWVCVLSICQVFNCSWILDECEFCDCRTSRRWLSSWKIQHRDLPDRVSAFFSVSLICALLLSYRMCANCYAQLHWMLQLLCLSQCKEYSSTALPLFLFLQLTHISEYVQFPLAKALELHGN